MHCIVCDINIDILTTNCDGCNIKINICVGCRRLFLIKVRYKYKYKYKNLGGHVYKFIDACNINCLLNWTKWRTIMERDIIIEYEQIPINFINQQLEIIANIDKHRIVNELNRILYLLDDVNRIVADYLYGN